jgi:hypothetical protein
MSLRTTSADKRKTPKQPPKTSSSTNSSAQYNCGGVGSCFSFEPDTRFRQFDWKFIQPVEWRTESWDFKASTCISGPGVLAQVAGSPLFQGLSENVGQQQVTPEQAQAVSPEVVQQLATHAEK